MGTKKKRSGANLSARGKPPSEGLVIVPLRRRVPRNLAEAREDLDLLLRNERYCRYLIGERLAIVRNKELWREAGFGSMKEFMGSLKHPSLTTLYECMNLADAVPADVVKRFDTEMIEAGIQLLPRDESGQVFISLKALLAIEITAERGGRSVRVPFTDASVGELVDEIRRGRVKALPPTPPELERKISSLQRRFGEGVTQIAAVRRQRQGSRNVVVVMIDEDKVEAFERMLR